MTDFYKKTPEQQADCYRQLAESVLPEWGIDSAHFSLIKMRENVPFKLETSDGGQKRVLRIHRAGFDFDDALRSEMQWIQALAEEGIETPEVFPTRSGQLFAYSTSTLAGDPRQIDMFAWVNGTQLGSGEEVLDGDLNKKKSNFRAIGELAGRVHPQSAAWRLPAGFTRHAWDVDGLAGDQPFLGRFWKLDALSKSKRHLMERARDRIRREFKAIDPSPESYGIIHADMAVENILVDGDHVRLIDFDDSGFGWYLFELATALYFN